MSKKRFVFLILLIIVLLIPSTTGLSMYLNENLPPWLDKYDVRILFNGEYLNSNINPIELNNHEILIPLRTTLEKANYNVKWNKNGIIDISNNKENFSFNSKDSKYKIIFKENMIFIDLSFFNNFKNITINYDDVVKTVVIQSSNIRKTDVYSYDLGYREMHTLLDRDLKYKLNGSIAIPNTDNNPLIIIMHGSHHITESEFNRYDLGYSYLTKELANNGYTAISLNVGINYSFENGEPMESERMDNIFEETLKSLIDANNGVNNNFGINLKNKINFNKVGFIGHSRSGQEVFRLATKYNDDERINIKGLMAIAPSTIYVMDYNNVDIPTSIILPELDGDVTSLDGQRIFDEMINFDNKKSESQLIYLYGANHNAFNQNILYQDLGKHEYKGEITKISPKDQRDFTKKYSTAFFDTIINDKSIYKNLNTDSENFLGYKALVSNFIPGKKVYKSENNLKNITMDKTIAEQKTSSYIPKNNTAGIFNHPGDNEDLKLLNIKWNKKNSNISFKVNTNLVNKNNELLSIYMAQDSTNLINKNQNQSFQITLKDVLGKKSSILLDKNTPCLKYHDGESIYENTVFSSHTPLSIINIPLNNFKNINTNNIDEISFDFTENNQGSLMLKFIQFN